MQVTITVPDATYRRAEHLARASRRGVADVLADSIALSLAPLGIVREETPISELSDGEVLALSELQLSAEQDRRLSVLLERQQADTLQPGERGELAVLMGLYQTGLVRKAEALMEAVTRGLREPLGP